MCVFLQSLSNVLSYHVCRNITRQGLIDNGLDLYLLRCYLQILNRTLQSAAILSVHVDVDAVVQ